MASCRAPALAATKVFCAPKARDQTGTDSHLAKQLRHLTVSPSPVNLTVSKTHAAGDDRHVGLDIHDFKERA
jgi:hypothetical protein